MSLPLQKTIAQVQASTVNTKGTRVSMVWNDGLQLFEPLCSSYFTNGNGSLPDKLDAANSNLSQIHTDLSALGVAEGNEATLLNAIGASIVATNTKLDTIHADLQALLAAMPVSVGLSTYAAALSLLSNDTIKSSGGKVYSICSSGAISLSDGAAVKAYFPAGVNIVLWQPLTFTTSIKISAIAAANTTIQYL